jgi:hypothetical protein
MRSERFKRASSNDRFCSIVEGFLENGAETGLARWDPLGIVAQQNALRVSNKFCNISDGYAFFPRGCERRYA